MPLSRELMKIMKFTRNVGRKAWKLSTASYHGAELRTGWLVRYIIHGKIHGTEKKGK